MSTPRSIALLPDAVANQIAAGEVVERPASVVKELMENALDAGARQIIVRVENGGKTLLEVADDGSGMGRADALLALDRHATSKIRQASDLVGIGTFGFRGEALPAIASVSRFVLLTATADEGTQIEVTGGRVMQVTDATRQRGTTVTARALFFNTPARRKFLRSTASESRAIVDVVSTLALSHPAVGMTLELDGRPRLSLPPDQPPAERLSGVWGRNVADTLLPLDYREGAIHVVGQVQRPADALPAGRRTQLFVNGRPFRDPFLIRAAEAGYRSAIHPGDRPSLLLDLRLDPAGVDVNVHPAKLEVRFRDRFAVERAVEAAVRATLGTTDAAAVFGGGGALPVPLPTAHTAPPDRAEYPPADLFAPLTAVDGAAEAAVVDADSSLTPPTVAGWVMPVLQVARTWLCYEAEDSLIIVDQHSAHERVLYEEVMAQITGGAIPSQRLLLPMTIELTSEELDAVADQRELLRRIGFEVEPFGGRAVMLHGVPNPHPRFDGASCFREIAADLARGRFGGWANPLERFAATYACRAAIKAGQALDERSIRELLQRLQRCTLPPHDVHGRSTIVQLPLIEVERRFGRR